MLSLRQYNLVLVVDPDDWRVKWHQTGPWRRQHHPEFNPDGTITVFNNNTYRLELGERDRSNPATPRVSNIMRVDPATGRTKVVYGERAGQKRAAFSSPSSRLGVFSRLMRRAGLSGNTSTDTTLSKFSR